MKKTPAKKTPAKKTPAKKTPAKKTPAKKTPAKAIRGSTDRSDDRKNVRTRHIKILWGRAAGRCAFPDCRRPLVEAQGTATWGNICHIVAESIDGPRGTSILTKQERNDYANLILLCSHHHDEIDTLPRGPILFPVETLHHVKSQHELWVEENLSGGTDQAGRTYAAIVDELTHFLDLANWDRFSDMAVRDMIPYHTFERADDLLKRQKQYILPSKHPKLTRGIQTLISDYLHFVNHFSLFCELDTRSPMTYRTDFSYKRGTWNPHYDYFAKKRELWAELNEVYLSATVIALNEFSDRVREFLNPLYFVESGRFLVNDSMGIRGLGGAYLPSPSTTSARRARFEKLWGKHLGTKPNEYP